MTVIPEDRPVLGKDLDTLRRHHGLMTAEACYIFGLNATNWAEIVRQTDEKTGTPQGELPIKDPSLALLARFIDRHPEVVQVFRAPRPQELFDNMNTVASNIDQKRFALLFGNEGSGGYRWLKTPARMAPAVTRLMHFMSLGISSDRSTDDRWDFMKEWYDMVLTESRARGIPDIYLLGKWNPTAQVRRKVQPTGTGDSAFQLKQYVPNTLGSATESAPQPAEATDAFLESQAGKKGRRRTPVSKAPGAPAAEATEAAGEPATPAAPAKRAARRVKKSAVA